MSDRQSSIGRRSPLAYLTQQLAAGLGSEGVRIAELAAEAYVNLRGDPVDGRLSQGVQTVLAVALPAQPNTFTAGGPHRCIWLGPDEWLLSGEASIGEELTNRVALALTGQPVSLIDVSAAYATLQLTGPRSREVLAKACSLDFHERAFRPGQCAQSNFARTQALVTLESDAPVFRLIVRRSFAPYLAEWLLDAMRD
jgi:sarcosine oxidase subunit gamma